MNVLVIFKRSNLEAFVLKWGKPNKRQREVLERTFRRAHDSHALTMQVVAETLDNLKAKTTFVRREDLQPFDEKDYHLVVTVGGDGTLLSTAPFLDKTPVLAVNSAPFASVGFFAAAIASNVPTYLRNIAAGKDAYKLLWRMRVELNGKQVGHPALNDVLVCHPHPVITTRVAIKPPGARSFEEQKNSGVWVSTPAGSSSAARAAGGKLIPLYSKRLQYVVREPYLAADKPPYRNTHGFIEARETLWIASRLPNARVYVDGTAHEQHIGFNDEVSFRIDPRPLRLHGRSKVMDALHKR